jgi:sugar phosphate isomerase/epimerase
MWRHGYDNHGEYVNGPEWRDRRRRLLRELQPAGCRMCARAWFGKWPIHHKSYERAGAGHERNRDLIPVCDRCHHFIHSLDRKRGLLRHLGLSLRATTWVALGIWWPVRAARRVFT